MNCFEIMDMSMLVREVESSPNSGSEEDVMMVVVALKGFIQFCEAVHVVNIVVGNITEFQETSKCLHHFVRDIPQSPVNLPVGVVEWVRIM